jgi:hypothetical protein
MMPVHIALTTLTDQVQIEELARVATALQVQIMRDLAPQWGVTAIVGAFSIDSLPLGYLPVIVQDTLDAAAAGFHRTRHDDSPYIIVPFGPTWSLAASHEVLRMLVDPTGSGRHLAPSPMSGQGTVEFIFDICAPCQDIGAAYTINGVIVSDFCYPAFFSGQGGKLSFSSAVKKPLEAAPNGIVTWLADDALVYQSRADQQGRIRIHGGVSPGNRNRLLMRELLDRLTPGFLYRLANSQPSVALLDAEHSARRGHIASQNRFSEDIGWRFGHVFAQADEPPATPARTSGPSLVVVSTTPSEKVRTSS